MGLPSMVVPVEISFLVSPLSSRSRKPSNYVFHSFFFQLREVCTPHRMIFEQVFSNLAESFPLKIQWKKCGCNCLIDCNKDQYEMEASQFSSLGSLAKD